MLKRFSLYGFLKNQNYYEPFLLLAFLQMGLNYLTIGLLIAFRELMLNILEIPSGAIADLWGRRKSMIVSFMAYIIYFLIIGTAGVTATNEQISFRLLIPLLFLSMIFYAIGDAFRTGTHKAMIFTWLRINGRIDEKTKIYGYTRSWSKIGSAISVIIACFFVFYTNSYIYIFYLSIIPYLLNIINFLGYGKELDAQKKKPVTYKKIFFHLKESFTQIIHDLSLRRLVYESMGFEGFFKSIKDYLQPILKQSSLPVTALLFSNIRLTEQQQSIILIGPIYFFLYLLSAFASRKSHKLVKKTGCEESTARFLWLMMLIIMLSLIPALYLGVYLVIIVGFIALYTIQNLWRPVLISRFDNHSREECGATLLSIESQSKSVATMIIAPIIGLIVDSAKNSQIGTTEFWPVAIIGVLISGFFFLTARKVR